MESSRFDGFDKISEDELRNIQFTGLKSTITNAYSNVVSSFFGVKFQRSIEELLVSPMPTYLILIGFLLIIIGFL